MTVERQALNLLLDRHPDFDLLAVDWQLPTPTRSESGPWLRVTLGQRSADNAEAWARHEYAIWKRSGDIYFVGFDGAVSDEPIFTV